MYKNSAEWWAACTPKFRKRVLKDKARARMARKSRQINRRKRKGNR